MFDMIGATISAIDVTRDLDNKIESVTVRTDLGNFNAFAQGDCCAYAWIDEIAGEDTVIGGTILSVSTPVYEDDPDFGDVWDVRDKFTEVVSTEKGDFALFCFCEHNGYYGGWISWSLS